MVHKTEGIKVTVTEKNWIKGALASLIQCKSRAKIIIESQPMRASIMNDYITELYVTCYYLKFYSVKHTNSYTIYHCKFSS